MVHVPHSCVGLEQPYITKTIFSTPDPPVNLTKIAIGNGAMGAEPEYEVVPAVSTCRTSFHVTINQSVCPAQPYRDLPAANRLRR